MKSRKLSTKKIMQAPHKKNMQALQKKNHATSPKKSRMRTISPQN